MPVPPLLLLVAVAGASPRASATLHDQLKGAFHEMTAPLPPDASRGPACLTPLVRELTDNWDLFSPAEKAEMTGVLAPFADDLRDMATPPPDAPPPSSGSPCFSLTTGAYSTLDDPEGYFQIQYESSAISASEAQDFLDALKTGQAVELDELGWRDPIGFGTYPMIAYVYDDPRAAGAYTTVGWCPSVGYMPYIVAGSGSFYGGSWYQDMAVHEFNHASQFAYTDTAGSINTNLALWFWESTAVWMQENAEPSNNWWSTYISGYTDHPEIAMEASSQSDTNVFYHMYGMAIWQFYLDQHVGGEAFVQGIWDYAASSSDRNITADEMVEDMGEDFDEVYQGFIANNTAMDYREHGYYPDVDTTDTVRALPASGASSSRRAPEGLGQNYIAFDESLGSPGRMLRVSFDGYDRTDWYALLVQTNRSSVYDTTPIPLDNDQSGEIEIEFSGDHPLYLVVSPGSNSTTSRDYTWSASWVDEEGGEGEDADTGAAADTGEGGGALDTPDGTAGDSAFNTGKSKDAGVCGCASAPGPLALGWAVAALALARRRRR